MQDNWCGEEMSMAGHSNNWGEEEEVEIGMWNNNPSQETGNWSYKKMPPKVINNRLDLAWYNSFT